MSSRHRLTALTAVVVMLLGLAVPGGASEERAGTIDGVVYYLMDDNGTEVQPGPYLVPVARKLDASLPATTAMQALLAGPTRSERNHGISSAIPRGTKLLGISISGGVATVNLSGKFDNGGGSYSMQARLAQVVWTLTQFSTVDSVKFKINGTPTTVFGGEGVTVKNPSRPMDWEDFLPAIMVTKPAFDAKAGNPMRITGYARTFEATFNVKIEAMNGRKLARTIVTYGGVDSGEFGWFDITLPYKNHRVRNGIVKVWETSAQNGRPINVREYRVRLAPAG
jgi:hypothetical protein